ncbi:unnamed protein product [Malus baccata var. baccata]
MAIDSSSAVERMEVEVNYLAESNVFVQDHDGPAVGGQIAGSKNGTCHQCRQRKTEFAASCTNVKAKGPCTVKLCHSCLKNRYTLTAEQVAEKCPKCRGECNCSICHKKAGLMPTGIRTHEAKRKGYQSVADMLIVEKPQKKENGDSKGGNGQERVAPDKATGVDSPSKRGKEDALDQSEDVNSDAAKEDELIETCDDGRDGGAAVNDNDAKAKGKAARGRHRVKEHCMESRVVVPEVPLPQGTPLTTVAGVDLAAEDVGNALQFLKFCETFREFFKIEKPQAESVLRELSRGGSGRSGRPGQYSSVVRFHSYMLFFIQKGLLQESLEQASTNCSWFQDLANLVSASGVSKVDPVMKELPTECFIEGREGYDALNFSQKLQLLIFLCDEALNTKTLRGWIEEQNERSVQRKRDMKAKVALAKDKERDLQAKLQEQMAKRTTAENSDAVPISESSIPISESDSIASVLRSELAQAHMEVVEAMAMVPESNEICEAVRIEPYIVDADGHAFWKLRGDFDEDMLLQGLGSWDGTPSGEQWFVCGAEMKEPIDKYRSSLALKEKQTKREQRRYRTSSSNDEKLQLSQTSSESNEENAQGSQTPDSNGESVQASRAPECNEENMELGPSAN